jgi:hypothetical protein
VIDPENALFIGIFCGLIFGYVVGFFVGRYLGNLEGRSAAYRAITNPPEGKP